MTNGQAETKLEFTPAFVPEDLIIIPLKRVPEAPPFEPFVPFIPPEKKSIVINIETTGFNPLEHRIIAIGYQDPLVPNEPPTVILLEDEAAIISSLLSVIKDGGYNEFIGYGQSFDFRFILLRAMKHNIDIKEFYDMDLYDLMQAVGQGKFEFMYYAQKPLKLSDVADFLWGYPKPFTDLEMLKFYAQGNFSKVIEFTSSQITRILALYLLFRKISESPFMLSATGIIGSDLFTGSNTTSPEISLLTIPEAHEPETDTFKCDVCLSEFNIPRGQAPGQCKVCTGELKRI